MKILTSFLGILFFATASFAQDKENRTSSRLLPNAEAGIGLQFIAPTGTFKNTINAVPAGMYGHYYHRIGSKFMLGAEISTACMTHADYEVPKPDGEMAMIHEDENMWGLMIGGKFNFIGNSKLRSYTEIRAGANTFYTTISSCDPDLQEYNESRTHGTSFVSSIGLGFTFDPKAILKNESGKTWIALRGAYVAGTSVNYRNAPESTVRAPIENHVANSPLSYFDIGVSASWQINRK